MKNSSVVEQGAGQVSAAYKAIVDTRKNVWAYEIFNHSDTLRHQTEFYDTSVFNAPAISGTSFSVANSDIFLPLTNDGLIGSFWDFLDPRNVVVCIENIEHNDAEHINSVATTLASLRARGFRFSVSHLVVAPIYRAWQTYADFVKIDLATVPNNQLRPLIVAIRERTQANPIAVGVESGDQFSHLKSLGINLFQGGWFSSSELVKPPTLLPSRVIALQLFELLCESASIEEVEMVIKKDATLGINLLRIISPTGIGLRNEGTSIRQALILVGYERLKKWTQFVIAMPLPRDPETFYTGTIVRARMMELLAAEDGIDADPGAAFLIGLLSDLDRMLGCPMHSALAQLSLDNKILEILLGAEGIYGDMLMLVKACESESDADFACAFEKLNFSHKQINVAQLEALAWANSTL